MAALILPSRRVVQPQGAVEIDWSNPLARDLRWAGAPSSANVTRTGTVSNIAAANGTAWSFTNVSSSRIGSKYTPPTTGPCTLLTLLDVRAHVSNAAYIALGDRTTIGANGVSGFQFFTFNGSTYSSTSIGTAASDGPAVIIGRHTGSQNLLNYRVLSGESAGFYTSSSASASPRSHAAQELTFGGQGENPTRVSDCLIYLGAFWARSLAESEVAALVENPWQLFRPIQRRIWVPVAAGGATNYSLTADVGTYNLTGIDATLTYTPASVNYSLTADAGAYALTGFDAGLTFARRLLADAGSYSLTGINATLVYVPGGGAYTLTADTGAYSLTGNDAGLTFARSMTADVGSYTLNGVDAGLLVGRRLTADAGVYSLAGVDAALIYTALGPTAYALTAETGSYVLSGNAAGLTYTDGGVLIDTHDGFWAKEWKRIRAREKRKYQEEIQERVEEIQDEIAEVEQQIAEVKQVAKPKKATPARDFYAEQARIVEHLIARRNQLIDEEDEDLLLLL